MSVIKTPASGNLRAIIECLGSQDLGDDIKSICRRQLPRGRKRSMNKMTAAPRQHRADDLDNIPEHLAPFMREVIGALRSKNLIHGKGFYPGCGKGTVLIPLLNAGLDIKGIDTIPSAITELQKLLPRAEVTVDDFLGYPIESQYDYVLGLQLFQYCTARRSMRLFFNTAHDLLRPGGILALCVNSIHTPLRGSYALSEKTPSGSFTIMYDSGPNMGREIHFYSAEELYDLTGHLYDVLLSLRERHTRREDGAYRSQWEIILQKKQ